MLAPSLGGGPVAVTRCVRWCLYCAVLTSCVRQADGAGAPPYTSEGAGIRARGFEVCEGHDVCCGEAVTGPARAQSRLWCYACASQRFHYFPCQYCVVMPTSFDICLCCCAVTWEHCAGIPRPITKTAAPLSRPWTSECAAEFQRRICLILHLA